MVFRLRSLRLRLLRLKRPLSKKGLRKEAFLFGYFLRGAKLYWTAVLFDFFRVFRSARIYMYGYGAQPRKKIEDPSLPASSGVLRNVASRRTDHGDFEI